ncbi:hypothetical protein C3O72_10840 [Cronobacter sakazakii]|nr:hypothetical protein C3O72_10840 [Cronobacter sakazakii]
MLTARHLVSHNRGGERLRLFVKRLCIPIRERHGFSLRQRLVLRRQQSLRRKAVGNDAFIITLFILFFLVILLIALRRLIGFA